MGSKPGFELHGLQKLFATDVMSVKCEVNIFYHPRVIREYVLGEVARIKHCLMEKALMIDDADGVRRYVHLHQHALVEIMDKLCEWDEESGAAECCDELDDLLTFIRLHFPEDFDECGKAPAKHVLRMQVEISENFNALQDKLLASSTFEPLIHMVLDPLYRMCEKPVEQRISFHRLRFLGYILEHSKKVVDDGREQDDLDRNFIGLLLYLNYNSRKTFMQFVQFLRDFIPADLDVESKRASLSDFLKIAMQATVKPNTGYHPKAATLKSQLIDFLKL